ncbi:helix-turn-helix domain-containing protein [Micromonospora sp. NPDC047707]
MVAPLTDVAFEQLRAIRSIAAALGRGPSTISREVRRNRSTRRDCLKRTV